MIAAIVVPLVSTDGHAETAVAYASVLALMVGAITVLAGVFNLGFIADLLWKTNRFRVHKRPRAHDPRQPVAQLFGFSVDADGLIGEAVAFAEAISDGETVGASLAVGAACLVLIVGLQRLWPIFPAVLAAVVLAITAVAAFDLADRGVDLVGDLPSGFPPLTFPTLPIGDLGLLFVGALGISLVSLTDTISTASVFADKTGEEVDGNREMIGVGAASIAAGCFQGFPVSTSGSRTAVAFQSGSRTQVTGLVGAAAIVALLIAAPGLLREPSPAGARSSRHRRIAVPRGHRRTASASTPTPLRLRPRPRRIPQRRPPGGVVRHRCGRWHVDPQRVSPGLVAPPGDPRPLR